MNDKTILKATTGVAEQPKSEAVDLKTALAALKPFANLPISEDQPDDAHPAFQIQVAFVRAARALFPADFPAAEKPAAPAPKIEEATA